MFSLFAALTILITILHSLLLATSFRLVWRFKRRVTEPLLPRDHKHARRRGIINTVNKLLKLQCLNNGFHFLEFKSNWLNDDGSLNMKLYYDDDLHLTWTGNELLAKEVINFYYHSKYTVG